jgi:sulfur relay (sulfurtransferase) complex TusBCD TusD component (DsrE family)
VQGFQALVLRRKTTVAGRIDNQDDLATGFQFSGLGQLIEATLITDRFIIFG